MASKVLDSFEAANIPLLRLPPNCSPLNAKEYFFAHAKADQRANQNSRNEKEMTMSMIEIVRKFPATKLIASHCQAAALYEKILKVTFTDNI